MPDCRQQLLMQYLDCALYTSLQNGYHQVCAAWLQAKSAKAAACVDCLNLCQPLALQACFANCLHSGCRRAVLLD